MELIEKQEVLRLLWQVSHQLQIPNAIRAVDNMPTYNFNPVTK